MTTRLETLKRLLPLRMVVPALFLAATLHPSASAQSSQTNAEELKAAFIFNFVMFSTWNEASFTDKSAPLVIGIVGNDPFGDFIDELVKGESVQGHPIVVKRFAQPSEVRAHAVFICKDAAAHLATILDAVPYALTIGETQDFTERGGALEFYTENNKLKFEVNLEATKRSQASLSSRLLRLGKICCAN